MTHMIYRSLYMTACVLILATQGCGDGDNSGGGPTVPDGLPNYIGTWVASCSTSSPTFVHTLSISGDGQYWLVEREYDAAANCGNDNNLKNVKITTAVVSDISANVGNNQYDDLFLSVSKKRITPYSATQVSEWISTAFCGKTDWIQGTEVTFDTINTGSGCHQATTRPAVLADATTLSMNGRGEFDSLDPLNIIYTRQSNNPLLTGKIAGIPWMAISGLIYVTATYFTI